MRKPLRWVQRPAVWLRKASEWIVDRYFAAGRRPTLTEEIRALSGGKRGSVREYYVRKTQAVLCVSLIAVLVCVPSAILTRSTVKTVSNGRVQRPDYLESDGEEVLSAAAEGESEEEEITVPVPARKYSAAQVSQILGKASEELTEQILGENESPDLVRLPLVFPQTLVQGAVSASYLTIPYGIISENGEIVGKPSENGSVVEVQVTLSCQGKDEIIEQAFCVYPPSLSEKEAFTAALRSDVDRAGRTGAGKPYMQLPQVVQGRRIRWYEHRKGYSGIFIMLMFLVPGFLFYRKDQKVRELAKERQYQLGLDYSDLMWKMSMLLSAGLSIRAVFAAVASDYRKTRERRPRYAGEEVLYTCHELESGVSEPAAYEHFGRRCGRPEYIKLGGILAQNMKKGSGGLAALLEKEAMTSMENRRCAARKIGEQAGTKVLFPMILMFMVVITVLVVPAFMSM